MSGKPLRVLYNESHVNLQPKKLSPHGGPARFAQGFRAYFSDLPDFHLLPLLFSHQGSAKKPYIKETRASGNLFFELVFNGKSLRSLYKQDTSYARLISRLKPFLDALEGLIEKERPDVVFLNGFSLTNWMLLRAAHRQGIPTVIQHAGIWKKEVQTSQKDAFSGSIRRIFYEMERDTARWGTVNIFLNRFSEKAFCDVHNLTRRQVGGSVIVPLPIALPEPKRFKKPAKNQKDARIGVVGRWDAIKNHAAVLRLATSRFLPEGWTVNVVTRIPWMSPFAKKYVQHVSIKEPMSPTKLEQFYRSMDVLLVPSRFDVSPTVVAESLLQGTPVIISDQVGWQDEFKACGLQNHIISVHASGKALAASLEVIQKTPVGAYSKMQKYIRATHDPKKVFGTYAKLFRQAAPVNHSL